MVGRKKEGPQKERQVAEGEGDRTRESRKKAAGISKVKNKRTRKKNAWEKFSFTKNAAGGQGNSPVEMPAGAGHCHRAGFEKGSHEKTPRVGIFTPRGWTTSINNPA